MSGTDPIPAPDDRFHAVNEGVSESLAPVWIHQESETPPRTVSRPFPLHPNFWWGILWCIALLLCTQLPGGIVMAVILVAGMMLAPRMMTPDQMKDPGLMLKTPLGLISTAVGLVVAHALTILFSLLLLRIFAGRDWYRQVALRRPSWVHFALVLIAWPAFSFLANGVVEVLQYLGVHGFLFGKDNPMEGLEKALTGWALPPAVFVIAVMPAFSEELWCRAFLGRGLVGRHGVVLGVLGTSFLFGAIHVDPLQGLMAMTLGIGLHYIYLTTRSLLMPMMLHFLNNALSVTLPNIPGLAELDSTPQQGPSLALYTGSVALAAAVCWALYQSRARLVSDGSGPAWEPPYPGVACPPPGSGTHIHTPALSGLSLALLAAGLAAFAAGIVMTIKGIAPVG